MAMSSLFVCLSGLIILLTNFAPYTKGFLVPFLDRPSIPTRNSLLAELWSDRFADPFKILEQMPLAFDKDESLALPPVRVDWKEMPDRHLILMDVPGLKKEEIKVELDENRVLRVSGERKREEENKGEHWHRVERSFGKFWRQFRLPENVDLDTLNAKLANGVLTISLSKLAPDRIKGPKVVSIACGGGETSAEANVVKQKSSEAEPKQEL